MDGCKQISIFADVCAARVDITKPVKRLEESIAVCFEFRHFNTTLTTQHSSGAAFWPIYPVHCTEKRKEGSLSCISV